MNKEAECWSPGLGPRRQGNRTDGDAGEEQTGYETGDKTSGVKTIKYEKY